MENEYHYRWEWQLTADPAQLWPLAADTNRFNLDTQLPAVEEVKTAAERKPANGRRHLRFRIPILNLSWEEEPFNWAYPYCFGVVRHYQNGPLLRMTVQVDLVPRSEGGTTLVYQVWAVPRNWLGRLAIPLVIGQVSQRRFAAVFAQYDRRAQQQALPLSPQAGANFAPGGKERLAQMAAQLGVEDVDPTLLEHLVELIQKADDITLAQLRPYLLADYWQVPRHEVLELFLRATRVGILDFQWELMCPMCRGVEHKPHHLDDIDANVHCSNCNINYDVHFDKSVEVTFIPNAAIRRVEASDYCLAGPQRRPHVMLQQLLPPGETAELPLMLEPGRYLLRLMAQTQELPLLAGRNGSNRLAVQVNDSGWPSDVVPLSLTPTLHLHNETNAEQLLLLERTAWNEQAATAAEVTALQQFRDLFADEALRPETQISVGQLTIMFTDLRDSTRMYREIGDARAFGLVMSHFDVLREAIAAQGGSIVKTIGDAVMAVFPRPVAALESILQAQAQFAAAPVQDRPLSLKAAVHTGPAIAVNLNDRLDYFGTTINVASRMEKFSAGGDVILSQAVYNDPEVKKFLDTPGHSLLLQSFTQTMKGFDDNHFYLWRVGPEGAAQQTHHKREQAETVTNPQG